MGSVSDVLMFSFYSTLTIYDQQATNISTR